MRLAILGTALRQTSYFTGVPLKQLKQILQMKHNMF